MSRYAVDKLMRLVNQDEVALADYTRDPARFVEKWEREVGPPLAPDERQALATRDYGRLYALGAHPFLLWSFIRAVWEHDVQVPWLIQDYKAKAREVGYPDFAT